MCGIYGIIDSNRQNSFSDGQVKQMAELLQSRGPDSHGTFRTDGVCLGMRRLAIIDLENGQQPIFNENRTLLIIYNGELYNYLNLRNNLINKGHIFTTGSDTEVILHAYEEYGDKCVEKLNGMFSFAVYHLDDHRIFLARDRLGIKPLYYSTENNRLIFSSEAKALLALMDHVEADWTAINRFFSFGYIPSPESSFAGINKFPPGSTGVWQNGKLHVHSYWQPDYSPNKALNPDTIIADTDSLLDECIHQEMMSDVPLGIFLSGGLDSSAIAVYVSRHSKIKVKSFGISFAEKTHDESSDARLVANHLGIDHYDIPFTGHDQKKILLQVAETLDEPFGDSTLLPLLKLARETRKYVKVVLTGWGGDELFAGYPTYQAHRYASLYRKLPDLVGNSLIPWVVSKLPVSDTYMSLQFKASRFIQGMSKQPEFQHFNWMGYFNHEKLGKLFTDSIQNSVDNAPLDVVFDLLADIKEDDLVDRILHLDAKFFLEGNGLFQCDRMTMAASLEARVPLLNNDIIDFVSQVPLAIKMRRWQPKSLLRDVMRPYLPAQIINKTKKGFGPPTSSWMRGESLAVLQRLFTKKKVEQQGIFSFPVVQQLIVEHLSRKADNGRNLWALLSFQLWYERYILGNQLTDLIEV